MIFKATSKTWTWTLKIVDTGKPGFWETWPRKNLDLEKPDPKNVDPEKHGINMKLKNV